MQASQAKQSRREKSGKRRSQAHGQNCSKCCEAEKWRETSETAALGEQEETKTAQQPRLRRQAGKIVDLKTRQDTMAQDEHGAEWLPLDANSKKPKKGWPNTLIHREGCAKWLQNLHSSKRK